MKEFPPPGRSQTAVGASAAALEVEVLAAQVAMLELMAEVKASERTVGLLCNWWRLRFLLYEWLQMHNLVKKRMWRRR